MRRAARTDANHSAVVGALRACGAQVWDCSQYGGGFPDLLILHRGALRLVEIKDGDKRPSARKLRPRQAEFKQFWPVSIIESVEGAVALLGGR